MTAGPAAGDARAEAGDVTELTAPRDAKERAMTETQPRDAAPGAPEEFVNTWLQGPFAPVDAEVTEYDLKVTGTIPAELEDGRLLRVGPNPVGPRDPGPS